MASQRALEATRNAYDRAYDAAIPLTDLISPSDVIDGADHWWQLSDELIAQEAHSGEFDPYGRFDSLIDDLAITLWADDLPRVSMDHLATDDRKQAVKWGYWPNSMSYDEIDSILWEVKQDEECIDAWHFSRTEAMEIVTAGYYDGSNPRVDRDPDRVF